MPQTPKMDQIALLSSAADYVAALDRTLDHIAHAHREIEIVRKSAARTRLAKTPVMLDVRRAWHAIDIAGVLAARLLEHMKRRIAAAEGGKRP